MVFISILSGGPTDKEREMTTEIGLIAFFGGRSGRNGEKNTPCGPAARRKREMWRYLQRKVPQQVWLQSQAPSPSTQMQSAEQTLPEL